jgi:phosphatidylinositol glycan class B
MTSVSVFYGSSPWHYYLSQGLPVLCFTALPFFLHGMWLAVPGSPLRTLVGCIGWTTLIYSLAGHKEWRFLHPLLPMMHIVASKSVVDLTAKAGTDGEREASRSWLHRGRVLFLVLNVPAMVIAVGVYSDGPMKAMNYLRRLPSEELGSGSVGFLMPCHSTPWQSYLHQKAIDDPGRLWALSCEPPLRCCFVCVCVCVCAHGSVIGIRTWCRIKIKATCFMIPLVPTC